jgi:HEAT repeat protein
MSAWLAYFESAVTWLLWAGLTLAICTFSVVVMERVVYGLGILRQERLQRRYRPLLQRALAGDDEARLTLVASPSRHRLVVANLLIAPLLEDRDPERIAATRRLADAVSFTTLADRFLRSRWWWQRARALRAIGLLRYSDYTAVIITALDDPNPNVRVAALDALSDLKDPRSLPALIVRMHDLSLPRGRRAEALAAFGSECEAFVLDLAAIDREHTSTYALVLSRCGTARSLEALSRWTTDDRATVRAVAFEGLAHVGLDEHAAHLSIDALNSDEPQVRAMAARALRHWLTRDAAAHLGAHLDDEWLVAVEAAHSLRAMREPGLMVLQEQAARTDLAGLLARQMLWEVNAQC